ncbi:hypothetical protein ACVWV0_004169 [Ewingella americana]
MLWKASETFSIFRKIEEKPCVATQTGPKVKTVGSPPTRAQRVLNETLWNPAFFSAGRSRLRRGGMDMFHVDTVIATKCRRLGGSLSSGFEP